jgi:phosphate-selective porin OprO and OprP
MSLLMGVGALWAVDEQDEPSAAELPPYSEETPIWWQSGSGQSAYPLEDAEGDFVDATETPDLNPPSASELPPLLEVNLDDAAELQDDESGCYKYPKGLFTSAADNPININVWGRIDFRAFNHSSIGINEFLVRYARVNFRGILGDWAYMVGIKIEGSSSSLWEAYLDYRRWTSFRFRAGQFKEPFSYEQLLQAAWLPFLERAMGPHNLAPGRDIGLQMFGSGWRDRLSYAVGIFNGDGPNTTDTNTSKEAAGRLVLSPWLQTEENWIKNLSVGGSFTTAFMGHKVDGEEFVTEVFTPFLTFGTDDTKSVYQRGYQQRWGAEVEWLISWFKFYGEYIWEKRHNLVGVFLEDILEPPFIDVVHRHVSMVNSSWYAAALFVLTGEREVRNGPIAPCHPLGHCGGAGAWELGFRYDAFHTNAAPFDAHIVEGTRNVRSWTVGLNWYPTIHIKMAANVYHADFERNLYFFGRPFDSETAYIIAAQFYW